MSQNVIQNVITKPTMLMEKLTERNTVKNTAKDTEDTELSAKKDVDMQNRNNVELHGFEEYADITGKNTAMFENTATTNVSVIAKDIVTLIIIM